MANTQRDAGKASRAAPGQGLVLGIDGANLRRGGGRTHLVELLRAARPQEHGIDRVIVWAAPATLGLLEDRDWLSKRSHPALDRGLLRRSLWQSLQLSSAARSEGCHVLFVPGGSYSGSFHPVVVMCRNMLPFEWPELRRYGWSGATLRLLLLRLLQTRSFRRADGLVFLTGYAREAVQAITGPLQAEVAVIPHGLNPGFRQPPRKSLPIAAYSEHKPFSILYVSIINHYKHQWRLVEAMGRLRERTGWPLTLTLVGPAYAPALRQLQTALARWDPDRRWVACHGELPHAELSDLYRQADLGVFASSCENMPNVLLETMAAGLPVACSDRGPMPGILGDAGVYFDPVDTGSIGTALEQLIRSPGLRAELATRSFEKSQVFQWETCARETFGFLSGIRPVANG